MPRPKAIPCSGNRPQRLILLLTGSIARPTSTPKARSSPVEHCQYMAEVGGSIPSRAYQFRGNRLKWLTGRADSAPHGDVFGPAQDSADQRYIEERAYPALSIWPSPTTLRPASRCGALTWDRIRRGHSVIHCPGKLSPLIGLLTYCGSGLLTAQVHA